MFRGLNSEAVDLGELSNLKIHHRAGKGFSGWERISVGQMYGDSLGNVVKSSTRGITYFGANYSHSAGSPVFNIAQESDNQFYKVTSLIQGIIGKEEIESSERKSTVNPAIESVLRGVEAGGTLGVRALQLAVQLHRFEPAVERRLSESFDSNPGLNKLLFWENLLRLTQRTEGSIDGLTEFLQGVEVGDYLGGGSLYTTYAATKEYPDGRKERIVLKMLNPNTKSNLGESYDLAYGTLTSVEQDSTSPLRKQQARLGLTLIDLSRQWCLRDIGDTEFEKNDDRFQDPVTRFNKQQGREVIILPGRRFTSYELKSEVEAEGVTVNRLLNDSTTTKEEKREVVSLMGKFFAHQLREPAYVDSAGQKHYLIHSDPHVGNYIVTYDGGNIQLTAIDRSMYLDLTEDQVKLIDQLIRGDNRGFLSSFIDYAIKSSKTHNQAEKDRIRNKCMFITIKEYGKQLISRKIDNFAILRTLQSEFESEGLDIGFEVRLMIRNTAALRELSHRNGVDIKKLLAA